MSPEIEARMQRLAGRLHGLGPRAVHELLTEVATVHGLEADVLDRLERYGRLDPNTAAALGGDRFPPRPILAVRW
ncbi:citrate/2-methylcitrate synthase [Azospirillum doebereinerae]|uniref:citrate/2-methylcitrate synthase n=1 Tax=Azospirillum doebereinerae TaxID=92933 RepID=UPI001EE4F88F|nr:citrate/2-methylcitrate synthase [Azospirillum doebereinerae]MCG5240851.1 citrate/2-methylcitrate synthase [Azospirillum doebereinerae]